MSLLQKMNKIIKTLGDIGQLSNDLVTQWNTVMEWVMNDGLTDDVNNKLDSMVTDGTLTSLISVEILGDVSNLTTNTKLTIVDAVNEVNSSLADIATNIKTQSDLQKAIDKNVTITVNIGSIIDITSNMTIPNTVTLNFNNGGLLRIASSVTLTLNGHIDAEERQIFQFVDSSSVLTSSSTRSGDTQRTYLHTKIKLSWFGAKGDAVMDWTTTPETVTGTDDSVAIKRALAFADVISSAYPNLHTNSFVTIEGKPNAMYYVNGDNILGCQTPSLSGVRYKFVGNGCTFYHKPLTAADSFIGNGRKLNTPDYSDFGVQTIGISGRMGYFFNTNGGDTFNSVVKGHFHNVNVNDFSVSCGYDVVFEMNGDNMGDNFVIERVNAVNFNKFVHNTNDQAMGWLTKKCQLNANTENAVYFHYVAPNSGGFDIENIEIGFLQKNETLVQVDGSSTQMRPVFNIQGRIEVHQPEFTLFNVDDGDFNITGLDVTYGFSGTLNDNSISARINKNAFLHFKNCTLSENFTIECFDDSYLLYNNSLKTENCSFYTPSGALNTYPKLKFKNPNGVIIKHSDLFSTSYTHRRIDIQDPRYGNTQGLNLPITYDCNKRAEYKAEILGKRTGGKVIIPFSDGSTLFHNLLMPSYSLITSLKIFLRNVNLANCDTIEIDVLGSNGGLNIQQFVDLNSYVSGNEVLTNQMITLQQGSQLSIKYFKGATVLTDITKIPDSRLEISYKSMLSAYEYNGGTIAKISV
jgi:hypothetical protein